MLEYLKVLDEQDETSTYMYSTIDECLAARGAHAGRSIGIFHFNIRSIRKNFNELLVYLDSEFDCVDIVVLSECWLRDIGDNYAIPGYSMYCNESRFNKNDGVIVYIKDTISVESIVLHMTETNLLKITFEIFGIYTNIYIGLTASYRSPATDVRRFVDDLTSCFSDMKHQSVEIFLGDININLLDNLSGDVNYYRSSLIEKGFRSYINIPTRVTEESGTVIDHIFVRKRKTVENIGLVSSVIETNITDHFCTSLILEMRDSIGKQKDNMFNSYRVDGDRVRELLATENWNEVLNCDNVQKCYTTFIDTFKNI